jgi:hypothetical protein
LISSAPGWFGQLLRDVPPTTDAPRELEARIDRLPEEMKGEGAFPPEIALMFR